MENICVLPATDARVLLASHSPRRRELMAMIVPEFETASLPDVEETYPDTLHVDDVAVYLSRLKAEAYRRLLRPGEIIVTADTVVIVDDTILGKPANRMEAIAMLMTLSGRQHRVMTGVTLTSTQRQESFAETTVVTFDTLTQARIVAYVDACRPTDKAGAYGIQEWIGAVGIKSINGDYYNVMGLPVNSLYHHLSHFYKNNH